MTKFMQINNNDFVNISEIKSYGIKYDNIFYLNINDKVYEYYNDNPYIKEIIETLKKQDPNFDWKIIDDFLKGTNNI